MTELLTKYYTADELNFTPGERSFVAWVSTEQVDREGDIVVAAGVDFKTEYLANPVVMAIHDYGKWPVGQCEWLKVKTTREWAGLYGKANIDNTPDTEIVWKKIQLRTVRGVSIGFDKPADWKAADWAPPTAAEVKKNPHWAGARRIIRRCKMVEFSICPIGMNPSALIEMVSKGLHKPEYLESRTMDEPEKVDPTPDPVADDPEVKAYDPDVDEDDDSSEEGDDDADMPIRKGHCVKCVKGAYKGMFGRVKSIHRREMVPDVADDVMGTKADPAARMCCYKAIGDGHAETSHHVGCKVAHLERIDDLKPPSKQAKKAVDAHTPKLPPLDGLRSIEEVQAERLAALREAAPIAAKAMAKELFEQLIGVV